MDASAFDPRDFRQALGMFATGVTIVTARAADGTAVGITANSFNSVSLYPPMVLWSLARNARSLAVFMEAEHWNVHVLANDQEALSNRFARAGEDKFSGLSLDVGLSAAPLMPDCSARFQCRSVHRYDGGDHIIFVGEVMGFDRSEHAPLLYVTGGYALAARKAGSVATEPGAKEADAPYSEDLLGYLLGRAHFQYMAAFRHALQQWQLSDEAFFVLSLLSVREGLTQAQMAEHMAYTGVDLHGPLLAGLLQRGLLLASAQAEPAHSLSPSGRQAMGQVLAAAKAVEAEVAQRMGAAQALSLRNLLKHAIAATDPGVPKLWGSQGAP